MEEKKENPEKKPPLSLDELEDASGGSIRDVSFTKTHDIDDDIRGKIEPGK